MHILALLALVAFPMSCPLNDDAYTGPELEKVPELEKAPVFVNVPIVVTWPVTFMGPMISTLDP